MLLGLVGGDRGQESHQRAASSWREHASCQAKASQLELGCCPAWHPFSLRHPAAGDVLLHHQSCSEHLPGLLPTPQPLDGAGLHLFSRVSAVQQAVMVVSTRGELHLRRCARNDGTDPLAALSMFCFPAAGCGTRRVKRGRI